MFKQLLIFIVFGIVITQQVAAEDMNGVQYNMVRVLDTIGQNFLFRTVKPVNQTEFLFEDLVTKMKKRALEDGFDWNDNLKVHLYSFFLSNSTVRDEQSPLVLEQKFFKQNPGKGRLIHFELGGSIFYANNLPPFMRQELSQTYSQWSWDRMDKLIPMMYDDLRKQEDYQKVLVFHCWTGLDRTGEVFGSYLMQIKNWSYQKTLDYNNKLIDGFPTRTWSRNGLNWYCWYLHYHNGQGGDCLYEPEIITSNEYSVQP